MKKNTFRQFVALFAFVAMLASLASCNRGYGCPTNFSADTAVEQVIKIVGEAIHNE
ncbi:MAG: hypothetical protein AAGK47_01230 [Bacteroidota bacterium]